MQQRCLVKQQNQAVAPGSEAWQRGMRHPGSQVSLASHGEGRRQKRENASGRESPFTGGKRGEERGERKDDMRERRCGITPSGYGRYDSEIRPCLMPPPCSVRRLRTSGANVSSQKYEQGIEHIRHNVMRSPPSSCGSVRADCSLRPQPEPPPRPRRILD